MECFFAGYSPWRSGICGLPMPRKLSAFAMTSVGQSMIPTGWMVIRTS
jgi:hypothetical protein